MSDAVSEIGDEVDALEKADGGVTPLMAGLLIVGILVASLAIGMWQTMRDAPRSVKLSEKIDAEYAKRMELLRRWGTPTKDYIVQGFAEYLVGTPDRTRCATWCLEYLDSDSFGNASRVDDSWRMDRAVPIEWRALPSDYEKSGYDRGHLAAAANHDYSEKALASTFILSNAIPQTPELNRGPWKLLEDKIRNRVKEGQKCWVITLPLYMTNGDDNICVRTIGDGIHVPTHCGKIVLWGRQTLEFDQFKMECWILPNIHEELNPNLNECRVEANKIESVAGLDVFSGLPRNIQEQLESEK